MNNNINILFLCGCYSESKKEIYFKNCKHGYQSAAQVHQEAILRGFIENKASVDVLSIPFLPSYPFNYKNPLVRPCPFIFNNELMGKSLGFVNVPFFKSRESKVLSEISHWYKNKIGAKVLLLYSLNYSWFKMAVVAKKHFPELHVCVIVPDLPVFCETGRATKIIGKEAERFEFVKNHIGILDSYVLLSNPMAEALGVKNKPYVVIEGIHNKVNIGLSQSEKTNRKYMLYTGKLSAEFGLKDLVDAFMLTKTEDVDLVLCGDGDIVPHIKACQDKDNRIKYLGTVSNEKCVALQRDAYLLINPRHSYEEFTKYSFPSKTMEYMASGTPTLMCRLECLPDEYTNHLIFFNEEDVESMAQRIDEVLAMDDKDLKVVGEEAKAFIENNKGSKDQVSAMLTFLNEQIKKG